MGGDGDNLFGYPIPFPKSELFIAIGTVAAFLPAIVILHFVFSRILGLFSKRKQQ
jgi:hypothetical protein